MTIRKDEKVYQQWLDYIFKQEITDSESVGTPRERFWSDAEEVTYFLNKTFAQCGSDLSVYSNAQVTQGLFYIFDGRQSNIIFELMDNTVPEDSRLQAAANIKVLYRDCFGKRCAETLSSKGEPTDNPLNKICYMLWDIAPLTGWNEIILEVLEEALYIPHDACIESALHGLGHFTLRNKEDQVIKMIDKFLDKTPSLKNTLREYAQDAKRGLLDYSRLPGEATMRVNKNFYDQWIKFVFDRPTTVPAWYHGSEDFGSTKAETVYLLGKTFAQCGADLIGYSNAQLHDGLYYLFWSAFEISHLLEDKDVSEQARKGAIENIKILYRDCFAKRCTEALSWNDECRDNRLNSICYMIWDLSPLVPADDLILDVLEYALLLPHEACIESALHGLGHSVYYRKDDRIQKAIDKFLGENPNMRPALRQYAEAAKTGMVQ